LTEGLYYFVTLECNCRH